MRIIDLSVALKAGIASDPPSMLPKIEYMDHKQGAQDFAMMFPGLKPEQLRGDGTHHLHHPQRHASRCALAFSSHHEPGDALMDHR